jgi:hypothetical protein
LQTQLRCSVASFSPGFTVAFDGRAVFLDYLSNVTMFIYFNQTTTPRTVKINQWFDQP